ncbi:hypothetical protein H5410_001948 [Solanum commersonii]|uniref:Uncharacterized protein n=1 Tax=Solanum commersonii TaxID=4109 RepID=A0A9J6B1I7_SOLCO|nr:hypothetical protein H5410_001948 [Solanum commersonii]
MHNDVISHFKKWIVNKLSRKRGKKTSFFTAAKNPIDPPFEFGVGRVDLMDWFLSVVFSRTSLGRFGKFLILSHYGTLILCN